MASFKRVEDQHTETVLVKLSTGTANWAVGDLFSYVPATHVGAKITKVSEVSTALGAGYKVFLVAQGDAITEKSGLAYKNYKLSDTVVMGTADKLVCGYDINDPTAIVGYAAE